MSSVLALAGVTATMQDMIGNRLSEEPLATALGTVQVTALPPDRVELSDSADPMQVNVFLHQVSQNQGWSNQGAPERSRSGVRISAPPLVLDMHYLITVYGANPLRSEMLLAAVAQIFTQTPVPDRQAILAAINPSAPPSGFPTELANCGLEDQFEHLRITPEALSGEEMSKLWSALQARYRPTLGYRVTTAIIDSVEPASSALPVMRVNLGVAPFRRPEISRIEGLSDSTAAITPGSKVTLIGMSLTGPNLRLMVGETDLSAAITERDDQRIVFALPSPGTLLAGAHAVTVVHRSETDIPMASRVSAVSNPMIMLLVPQVSGTFSETASQDIDGVTYRTGDLTLTVIPDAGRLQRITVLLNDNDGSARSYNFTAPPGNGIAEGTSQSGTVVMPITDVAQGTYLLRTQIDAGESTLSQAIDETFNGPLVVI